MCRLVFFSPLVVDSAGGTGVEARSCLLRRAPSLLLSLRSCAFLKYGFVCVVFSVLILFVLRCVDNFFQSLLYCFESFFIVLRTAMCLPFKMVGKSKDTLVEHSTVQSKRTSLIQYRSEEFQPYFLGSSQTSFLTDAHFWYILMLFHDTLPPVTLLKFLRHCISINTTRMRTYVLQRNGTSGKLKV